MKIPYHPLKDEIGEFLEKYKGKEIVMKLSLGSSSMIVKDNNPVGTMLEAIIVRNLTKEFDDLDAGESNKPPDIFDEKYKWNLEIKAFINTPGFDIYSISKFFGSKGKKDWLSKSLHKTDYLIFEYATKSNGKIFLKSFWHKKLHEILGYGGINELSVQYVKGQYKNIRPIAPSTWDDSTKTPEQFIRHLKKFIGKLPTNITGNKRQLKTQITKQFSDLKQELSKNE